MSSLSRRFSRRTVISGSLATAAYSAFSQVATLGSAPDRGSQFTPDTHAPIGDDPVAPGPHANLSHAIAPQAVKAAMNKVATWQKARIRNSASRDWTFAALYIGLLSASRTLGDVRLHDTCMAAAEKFEWRLGPRENHADDHAIGQLYLALYKEKREVKRIEPLHAQFETLMRIPDKASEPVWWWCDALFMAPPVWARLAQTTHDNRFLNYMHRQWQITDSLLWNPKSQLFFRDASYLDKLEANGQPVFWSRGNGWVLGGLVRILSCLPARDSRKSFYESRLRQMCDSLRSIQSPDGLWRPGLLDPGSYPNPESSGSAFFVYAMAWGIRQGLLDRSYNDVVRRAWAGLIRHIYAGGRLGDIQPIGAKPEAFTPAASYVYGVGAFLLAGSELANAANAV